ncbi:hypothetical protein TRFO_31069 [Tritrichomonas foetus]|uniref:Tubby C-terminal domain-containing protein n=1 Tax=Tritrichomonas foetus TaxID=1144522 RepID=A0A1J4JXE6_9EUKA|nr:hypothetical protein TRFO_31069 [Tritrichomonas foetus]|eukprot:OHT01949.1 hypothetical protein TRFO_31069 [Tritrichomonas foetus]
MDFSNPSRDLVFTPIEKNSTFQGFFVRKKKTQKGKTMFYLYSEDEETLLLCAIESSSYVYEISRNAKNINKTDPYFCGNLIGNNSTLTYSATDHEGKNQLTIQFKKANERIFRRFSAIAPPNFSIVQREPQYINGVWMLKYPHYDGISSQKNFMMDFDDDYCIAFEKLHDEEYYFSLRYPLSLFQGFCLSLSVMKKFSQE